MFKSQIKCLMKRELEGSDNQNEKGQWTPEQVRKIFVYGNTELLANMDVMDIIFAYEAYPFIRPRFKTDHLWHTIFLNNVTNMLKKIDMTPFVLGDNERHNCLAWHFATVQRSHTLIKHPLGSFGYHMDNRLAHPESDKYIHVDYNFYQMTISIPEEFIKIRNDIVNTAELLNEPSLSISNHMGYLRTHWNPGDFQKSFIQLAQAYYVLLQAGWSFRVYRKRDYTDLWHIREEVKNV